MSLLLPAAQLRHMCRNARCGCRLKEPVDNPRNAFCCRGCFQGYFRKRCIVCERPMERKREDQHTCGRRQCKGQFARERARFFARWADVPAATTSAQETPISSALKPATGTTDIWPARRGGRAWRWFEDVCGGDQFLFDRAGRLAIHLRRTVAGWWIVHPRTYPAIIEPELPAARKRALDVALWTLPLKGRLARANRSSPIAPTAEAATHVPDEGATQPAEALP